LRRNRFHGAVNMGLLYNPMLQTPCPNQAKARLGYI